MTQYLRHQIAEEMNSKGFYAKELIPDGQVHRFDREGNQNAWYVLHSNQTSVGKPFAVIVFGDWRQGLKYKYCTFNDFSDSEKIEVNHCLIRTADETEKKLKAVQVQAIAEAKKFWNSSADSGGHPYLERKKIDQLYGARINKNGTESVFVLALRNVYGDLLGLQKIFESGKKLFISGQRNRGNFITIPDQFDLTGVQTVFVVEGFATGATVHMATNKGVVCALSANNISKVCWELKKFNRQLKIIIVGDDDRFTAGNPGKTKAIEAAKEINAGLVFPNLENLDKNFSDFNDVHCFFGLDFVKEQLKKYEIYPAVIPPAVILASQFLKERKMGQSEKRLVAWRTEFYQFTNKCYEKLVEADLTNDIVKFIQFHPIAWVKAGRNLGNDIRGNIEAKVFTPAEQTIPFWIHDSRVPVGDTISLANGIIDLTELKHISEIKVLPHTAELFQTTSLPFSFDPDAKCPAWTSFLDEMLPDKNTQMALQEWFGYNLVFDNSFQKFAIFYGQGANGKTVCCVVLRALLGDKNVSGVNLEAFDPKRTFLLAGTVGKLANIVEELNISSKTEEGELKKFVAGGLMTVEKKHKDPFEIIPSARLTFATNSLPRLNDSSEGIWRRMLLFPFKKQIMDPERQNRNLVSSKFWVDSNELPGVFNWGLEGRFRLRKNKKFTESVEMIEEAGAFKTQMNPTREFLLETCQFQKGSILSTLYLYENYVIYMKDRGYHPFAMNRFSTELRIVFPEVTKSDHAVTHQNARSHVWYDLTSNLAMHRLHV